MRWLPALFLFAACSESPPAEPLPPALCEVHTLEVERFIARPGNGMGRMSPVEHFVRYEGREHRVLLRRVVPAYESDPRLADTELVRTGNRIQGAVRARASCLRCHDGAVGDLLGAFVYEIATGKNLAPRPAKLLRPRQSRVERPDPLSD